MRGMKRKVLDFERIARLPNDDDNAAIALQTLRAGAVIQKNSESFPLSHDVLVGHRFAFAPIRKGEPLLSWGLAFGVALRDIQPGDYLCNEMMLDALRGRRLDFEPPVAPNFKDYSPGYSLDESSFRNAPPVPRYPQQRTFPGYVRAGGRGAGTRNYLIILGTSSWTAGYARALAERFRNASHEHPNIDGVVAVAHTEGGAASKPNNHDLLLRALAGFMVHPNVGAVLAVDRGTEFVNNKRLKAFMRNRGYPLGAVPHRFLTVQESFSKSLENGGAIVRSWLDQTNATQRSEISIAHLKIALQCGGSDAFSGLSGNPLAGWVARELIRHGGSANLAETPELIGAEPYVLEKVRDLETARAFLESRDRFQEWAAWHGHGAAGNPSGGNLYRGLYNILIKSIGAARKKDPEVRLDSVIEYGEPMREPGFYFMDSPGNDLESIAGQVAAGCNMILFITGNGSITNFPFVPTLKIVTTTERYHLLANEMDVNAGRFLDGEPLDDLGEETFELTLRVASGERSVGEKAGHSQVQLWREWRQTDDSQWRRILDQPKPSGEPQPVRLADSILEKFADDDALDAWRKSSRLEKIGLIVPTSLCSGQIAQLIVQRLNRERGDDRSGLTRYATLTHTEGCGVSRGVSEELFLRTLSGYIRHPSVARCLLLEHGCEKTHNDAMRQFLQKEGVDCDELGWASIQLDGGIDSVTGKVVEWFHQLRNRQEQTSRFAGPALGLFIDGEPTRQFNEYLALLGGIVLRDEGAIVLPFNQSATNSKMAQTFGIDPVAFRPTLAFGQTMTRPGFHLMEAPTEHSVEILTGLGATGVDLILAFTREPTLPAHPLIPVLQIAPGRLSDGSANGRESDFDLVLNPDSSPARWLAVTLDLAIQTLDGLYLPKSTISGNIDFQMTRGALGVSL